MNKSILKKLSLGTGVLLVSMNALSWTPSPTPNPEPTPDPTPVKMIATLLVVQTLRSLLSRPWGRTRFRLKAYLARSVALVVVLFISQQILRAPWVRLQ